MLFSNNQVPTINHKKRKLHNTTCQLMVDTAASTAIRKAKSGEGDIGLTERWDLHLLRHKSYIQQCLVKQYAQTIFK